MHPVHQSAPEMVGRRTVMLSTLGILSGCHGLSRPLELEQVSLWSDRPPGGGGPSGPELFTHSGALYNVTKPRLEIFRPRHPNGSAVLIAAGGGYRHIGMQHEAYPAARWLVARGVTAFVLVYRLPAEGWEEGPLAPLFDARRALQIIGQRALTDKLDVCRISLLGFSAGGHLMGMTASKWSGSMPGSGFSGSRGFPEPIGAALIYPVITLEKPYDRTAARRALVGANPDPSFARLWSVQSHVTIGYPPVFLLNADNDRVASPYNSALMAEICSFVGTSVDYHRLPSGGHGFGMGVPGEVTLEWPAWYKDWLVRRGQI